MAARLLMIILGVCAFSAHAQIDIGIQDIACNASTRPAVLDANDPWLVGPFDYTYQNGTYSPNMLCEWKIRMEEGSEWEHVNFDWLAFDVEFCTECKCDFVSVYDGPDDDSELIGTYCGTDIPPNIVSSGRDLFVQWETDETGQTAGFMARYGYPLQQSACNVNRPEVYGGPINSTGIFYSPNYPNNYPGNSNCEWLFMADNGVGRVRITLLDFATDEICQPGLDRLDLYNGATLDSPRMIRHTGWQNYFPVAIESAGPNLLAHFNTDATFHFRGFFGIWRIVE